MVWKEPIIATEKANYFLVYGIKILHTHSPQSSSLAPHNKLNRRAPGRIFSALEKTLQNNNRKPHTDVS